MQWGAGTRSPEQQCARFLANGKKYLEQKDHARAANEFRGAAKADPRNAEPHYQLALVSLATGDLSNAAAFLKKTTDLDPKHKDAQLKLAQLLATTRDKEVIEEAEKRVREVLARSPADADTLSTLAVVEWRLGKLGDAEEHLNQVFEKWPENLKSSLILARLKLSQKDVSGAEQVLKKVVDTSPGKADPLIALGTFYILTGKPPHAEQQLRQALQLDPKNGFAMVALAGIKLRAGATAEAEQFYKQASALADPLYKPVHGVFLFQSGKHDLAIAEFEKLATAEPANREARSRLVNAYLATKRLAEAEKVLLATLKKNPRDLDALIQISQIHLRRGQFNEVEGNLNTVLKMEPNSAMAHFLIAKVYQRRGASSRQRQELSEAVRLSPNLLPARIELAQGFIQTNDAKAALELLNGAPAAQRNTLPVLVQQNWAHLALGNIGEAGKGIQRALDTTKRPDLLLQQAILKLLQKDTAGARLSLEEALKLNPEDLNALNVLMQTYGARGQSPEALRKVREYAGQQPNSAELQHYLGEQLLRAGDLPGARKAFVATKTIDPGFTRADLSLAQVDISEGKLDDARRMLAGRVSANPPDLSSRLMLAAVEVQASNYLEAVEHYRKVIELDDRNVMALNNLAFLLAEYAKQPDEAVKYALRAKEIAPESATILDTLGWAYYRKGLYRVAIQHLELALSKEPSALRKGHLGAAYIKAGDRERGWAMIEAAMKMDPQLSQTRSFQDVMKELR